MVIDNADTKSKIEDLQRQMISIQREKNLPPSMPVNPPVTLPTSFSAERAPPPSGSQGPSPVLPLSLHFKSCTMLKKSLGFPP